MGKRIKIALNYKYDENWIGGTYYIENLIHALNTLPNVTKPDLLILTSKEAYSRLNAKIDYPFLKYYTPYDNRSLATRLINKVWYKLFKSNRFKRNIKVESIFPFSNHIDSLTAKKNIYWIPDFQEHYLTSFFSEEEIQNRKTWQEKIITSNYPLVLSSQSALSNFEEIYPEAQIKTTLLPFAVSLPGIQSVDFNKVKRDYSLKDQYYICPNQFWIHKDHITLIKAISILKNEGLNITVYLTGKTEDYRFPSYFESLQKEINDLGLVENIFSLGFLDRNIQLTIVKNAKAVIQPSLFEGWSTVIEDSKSLNKYIIASDIEVHKEQLKSYSSLLFEKGNPTDLAEKIKLYQIGNINKSITYNYQKDIIQFGEKFMEIVKNYR